MPRRLCVETERWRFYQNQAKTIPLGGEFYCMPCTEAAASQLLCIPVALAARPPAVVYVFFFFLWCDGMCGSGLRWTAVTTRRAERRERVLHTSYAQAGEQQQRSGRPHSVRLRGHPRLSDNIQVHHCHVRILFFASVVFHFLFMSFLC